MALTRLDSGGSFVSNRRGFLKLGLGAVASAALTGGKTRAQEPTRKLAESNLVVIDPSDFESDRDKTLALAKQLFKDLDIWISLSDQQKKDFCTRLHHTILFQEGKNTNEVTSRFLVSLNDSLRSDSISSKDQKTVFNLDHYLMLDLAFMRLKKSNPEAQLRRDFLNEVISKSGTIENQGNNIRTISFGQKIQNSHEKTEGMRQTYQEIKNKYFPVN